MAAMKLCPVIDFRYIDLRDIDLLDIGLRDHVLDVDILDRGFSVLGLTEHDLIQISISVFGSIYSMALVSNASASAT